MASGLLKKVTDVALTVGTDGAWCTDGIICLSVNKLGDYV